MHESTQRATQRIAVEVNQHIQAIAVQAVRELGASQARHILQAAQGTGDVARPPRAIQRT